MATVLVTGARRGIGRATAVELARRGHRVLAGVRRGEDREPVEEAVAAELRAPADGPGEGRRTAPGTVDAVVLDVADLDAIPAAVQGLQRHGPVDVLVNNAAASPLGPAEAMAPAVLREAFDTNVLGPLVLAGALLPAMRARGRGLLVAVSSAAAHPRLTPPALGIAYASSKAALGCWAEFLNKEVVGHGIRSIVVELGPFATDMTEPHRFAASIVPPDSPYAEVARVQEASVEGVVRLPVAAAAAHLADLVEAPAPPLRSVFPPELAALARAASGIDDDTYLALCGATSGRDWARRFQRALAGG